MKKQFLLIFVKLFILILVSGCNKEDNTIVTNQTPVVTEPRYIAVGGGTISLTYYSTDGNNWINISSNFPAHFDEAAYGNGIFVAIYVSNNLNYVARSSNGGNNWESIQFNSVQGTKVNHLVFENGFFLISATSTVGPTKTVGSLYSSSDGKNWVDRIISDDLFCPCWTADGVTFGNGNYVIAGSQGGGAKIWYSATLETYQWTCGAYISDFVVEDLDFSNGRFIVIGYYGSSQGKAFYTDNFSSTNWTQVNVCWGGGTASVQHLDYGNNLWVATYLFGTTICVSNDNGINWQAVQLGGSGNINNVSFVNGRFIAVGTNRILTSTNGIVWNEISARNCGELFHIAYGQ